MTPATDPRDRLAAVRARLGLTLDEMADALGVHRQTVYSWEHRRIGVHDPEALHWRLDRLEREHADA